MLLDSALLRANIDTFIGYGDYRAKYWLVGMEEGGGGSLEEVSRRLARWDTSDPPELLQLGDHHREGDLNSFVRGSMGLQTTWRQLIRIVLSSEGIPTDNDTIRAYQKHQLGRYGGETCLLELMPLASPNAGAWRYRDWSSLPELSSRGTYMGSFAATRADQLRRKIMEYQPAVVVFYSLSYIPWWRHVAGVPLIEEPIGGVKSFSGRSERTLFVVVPSPAHRAKGKGNSYYVQVGQIIAESLSSGRR